MMCSLTAPVTFSLCQIFKLMKMDSYRRFVRSPLYQRCTLSSVEGKLLPQISTGPRHMGSWEDVVTKGTSSDKKVNERMDKKWKYQISFWPLPQHYFYHIFLTQSKSSDSNSLPGGKSASEKRGSWGGSVC